MDSYPNYGKIMASIQNMKGRKVALLLSCLKCGYEKRATRPLTAVSKIIGRS